MTVIFLLESIITYCQALLICSQKQEHNLGMTFVGQETGREKAEIKLFAKNKRKINSKKHTASC